MFKTCSNFLTPNKIILAKPQNQGYILILLDPTALSKPVTLSPLPVMLPFFNSMAPSSPSLPTFLISFSACPFMILFTQIPKFQVPIISYNNHCSYFSFTLANITSPFSYLTECCCFGCVTLLFHWLPLSQSYQTEVTCHSHQGTLFPIHISLHLGRVILVSTCPAVQLPAPLAHSHLGGFPQPSPNTSLLQPSSQGSRLL